MPSFGQRFTTFSVGIMQIEAGNIICIHTHTHTHVYLFFSIRHLLLIYLFIGWTLVPNILYTVLHLPACIT